MANVKNPLILLRIVVLLTLVYPNAALLAQFAANHNPQNTRAKIAVCRVVRGGSREITESGRAGREVEGREREIERD